MQRLRLELNQRQIPELDNEWGDCVGFFVNDVALSPIDGVKYVGQAPVDLLFNAQFSEPSPDPGEVTIGRCTCGETGCGAVVARVYRDGPSVVWDLFASGNPRPVDLAAPKPAPDAIRFAADQYAAAISSAQRSATNP